MSTTLIEQISKWDVDWNGRFQTIRSHTTNSRHHLLADSALFSYIFTCILFRKCSIFIPSLIPGGYVISKIHIPHDNDFFPEQLVPLINGLIEFIEHEIVNQ